MSQYYIFSDASFSPTLKLGVGAVLILSEKDWKMRENVGLFPVQTKQVETPTGSSMELLTALWAFNLLKKKNSAEFKVVLFTDFKTLVELPDRREELELSQFKSKRTGLLLSNATLYKRFFKVHDELKPNLIWIKGHSPKAKQNDFQKAFACVDKASRHTLRQVIQKQQSY